MKNGFFAYSSRPESCGHAIESAITEINKSPDYHIKSWHELNKYGRLLIDEIVKEIEIADFFCADLTGINDNVLFEFGFAISKNKPLFVIFDTSITESNRRFQELNLFSTIGYQNYQNSTEIVNSFYDFASKNLHKGYFDEFIKPYAKPSDKKAILHLKSKYATESSRQIFNVINEFDIPTILDDASETKVQPISWYIEQLANVDSVVCEFVPVNRNGYELQNSKAAFISGITYGLGLELLMTCEEPYESPIDFRDIMKKYNSPESCKRVIKPFAQAISNRIVKILTTKTNLSRQFKNRNQLQALNFGDFIAENEAKDLFDYFIPTHLTEELIKKDLNIVVGRKGAGKSATLLYLNELLSQDKRNTICVIKPINFEIDALVSLIERITDEFEKNFLIEAIWKYLIITEIAKNLYIKIKEKQVYAILSSEKKFTQYIEEHPELYLEDISTRLENRIEQIIQKLPQTLKQSEFKIIITQLLHYENIYALKQHFADIIEKGKKIIVLIDNLDKSWRKDNKIPTLSRILLGLIGSADKIVGEISVVKQKQRNIDFHLTIFLRSDIFKGIIQYAREADKINPTWLKYDDYEVFFRIVEERFSFLNTKETDELWSTYITSEVQKEPTKNYIINRVLPRPRDIIFYFKKAQEIAVSRGHDTMNEADLIKAYEDYSSWVFNSLIVENGITIQQMEDFMYGLVGCNAVISINKLTETMKKSGIETNDPTFVEYFIDHIVSLSIIGRETKIDNFEFEFEFKSEKKNKILNERLENRRFKIHPVLYPYLEIEMT